MPINCKNIQDGQYEPDNTFLTFDLYSIYKRSREKYVFLSIMLLNDTSKNGIVLAELGEWNGMAIGMESDGDLLMGTEKEWVFQHVMR